MPWLSNIIRAGLSDTDVYQKKRGIIFSNYISLILCAAILVLFIFKQLAFGKIPYGFNLNFLFIGFALFLSPIVLNKFLLTTLSRLSLCFAPVLFLWYLYISQLSKLAFVETTIYDSFRMFLLTVSFLPYLLFDKRKLHLLILGILPTLVSIIFFEYLLNLAGVSISQRGILEDDYQLMHLRTFISYIVISGGCYTFHSVIIRNDELTQRLLSELKLKSEEIEVQNEELAQNQVMLSEVNQYLENLVENKTENIRQHNEKLKKYAYLNAHQVRGPVARLLGLVQLSAMECDVNYPWFFEKVTQEITSLDKIIQRIASELNCADNPGLGNIENQ
jgi:signal transduction histidine kinase